MRKNLLFYLVAVLMILAAGCSSEDNGPIDDGDDDDDNLWLPSTEVYVMGSQLQSSSSLTYMKAPAYVSTDDFFEDHNKEDGEGEEGRRLTRGNIEVVVHQQQHSYWNMVKISLHVRDIVEKTSIVIPVGEENISESKHFKINTYEYKCGRDVVLNGRNYTLESDVPVVVFVEHKPEEFVVSVVCTDINYINALRKEYEDGVTIDVYTHLLSLTKEDVWAKLKETKIVIDPEDYDGLIWKGASSAYFDE